MAEGSPVVRRALIAYFSSFACLIAGLQCSTVKLQIFGTASFLMEVDEAIKESPSKLLTVKFCSKLSSVKSSAQKRECF